MRNEAELQGLDSSVQHSETYGLSLNTLRTTMTAFLKKIIRAQLNIKGQNVEQMTYFEYSNGRNENKREIHARRD